MCEMTTLVVARTSEAPHEQLPCLLDQGVKSSTMTFGQDNSLVGGCGEGGWGGVLFIAGCLGASLTCSTLLHPPSYDSQILLQTLPQIPGGRGSVCVQPPPPQPTPSENSVVEETAIRTWQQSAFWFVAL